MKKLIVLFFILFTLTQHVAAQAPEPPMLSLKLIGGNSTDLVLTPVIKATDGGFILSYETGSTTGPIDSLCSVTDPDIIFQKYNGDATVLEWTKCFAADGDTFLIYMFPKNDGGIVFGGEYKSGLGWGFYICKQDVVGNIIWSHGYSKGNGPLLRDMIATNDGGYIMTGNLSYADTNFAIHYGSFMDNDIGVIKLDSSGNKVWSKVIGGTGDDLVSKIVYAPDGGCYIIGTTTSDDFDCTGNHGNSDAYLARLDQYGNLLWHNDLGGSGYDAGGGTYACADNKGGVIIATSSGSNDGDISNQIDVGGHDIWLIEVDSTNTILWNNCFGGGGYEYPNSVCKAADGSIWTAGVSDNKGGEIDTAYGSEDAWIVHADSVGNFINAKVLGSTGQDEGDMIYPLSNGNVIAGGYYENGNGSFNISWGGGADAFLVEFAPWTTVIKQVSAINNDIKIYPDPANEQVTIEMKQKGTYAITITDVMGRLIYKAKYVDKDEIDIKGWQRGLYYVQAISENGFKTTKKFLVE